MRPVGWLASVLLALVLADPAAAHSVKRRALEIVHPWAPAAPSGVAAAPTEVAVSMTIRNLGKTADRLIAASSPKAAAVLAADGGAALQASGIEIMGGTEVALGANGAHVRLTRLTKPLQPYDTLPLTLVFARAGKIDIEVLVEDMPSEAEHKHR